MTAMSGRGRIVFGANVREAVRSLAVARQRTVLGVMGIAIGIGSVIAMISVGLIAKLESLKEFETLGTDLLVVETLRSGQEKEPPGIPLSLAEGLAAAVPSIVRASPRLHSSKPFVFAGRPVAGSGQINGVSASFAEILGLELEQGRFISDLDDSSHHCVVGAGIAGAMRRAGAAQVVGASIKLGKHRYTVVGVLRDTPQREALTLDIDVNRSVFIPVWNALRAFDDRRLRTVAAQLRPGVHHTLATEQIASYFDRRKKGLKISVESATQLIEQTEKQMQLLTLLLGMIGSISLIVGGMGIMNIMVASIAERKKEIGLRRAVGAHRSDIQSQFLIEAVILCLLGGVVGIVAGVGGTWAVCRFAEWEFFVSWASVALGIGVASAVGVFFGFQPAWQAARLDPINALHAE